MFGRIARSRRRRWLVIGAAAVLLVAGGVAATAGWRAWQNRCVAAVPEGGDADLPPVVAADDLGGELNRIRQERHGDGTFDRSILPDRAAIALETGAGPFGPVRRAVVGPPSSPSGTPALAGDGLVLLGAQPGPTEEVWALDGATGAPVWFREQRGGTRGAVPLDDRVALVQEPAGQPLTVAAVDLADGQVRACTRVGEVHADWSGLRRTVATPVGEDGLAVLQPQPGDRRVLALVEPAAGTVRWERAVDLPSMPHDLRSVGDVLVANRVPDDDTEAWGIAVGRGDQYQAEELRLRAFSAADGAPAWEYAFAGDAGGAPYSHQIVGTTGELVLMLAVRLDEPAEALENHLVALDAATGQPRWTRELPPMPRGGFPDARRYGETVLAREPGSDGRLVGYDVETGDERWRVPSPVSTLDEGALLEGDGAVLLPGLAEEGLVTVDLSSGETRRFFDGITATDIRVDDATIAVSFLLGDDGTLVLYERR